MTQRLTLWNITYLALMLIGIAAAVYHAVSERYGNAIIAAGAAIIGVIVAFSGESTMEPERRPARQRAGERGRLRAHVTESRDAPHDRWLSGGILAGFAATIVMSLLLVVAYLVTGFIGSEDGGTLSRWFWGLSHNELTSGIWDIPIAAFSVNLLAGLAWALIYAAWVEPRLSGPGWWRGMLFSIVPWILSLVVFFPLVGAGFFGVELDAGPLPAIGNLILHLAYGAVLGLVYALPEVSESATEANNRAARLENDAMALGLIIGLTAGLVVGAIISAIVASDIDAGLNVTLAAGGIGVVIGGLIGSSVGVDIAIRREAR